MNPKIGVLTLTLCFTSLINGIDAQPLDEEEELALAFGDEEFISIATGRTQPIARAPAVATVITAEDIDAIGATDLDEVLETVPGLHVSVSTSAFNGIYTIRGIHSQFNPQVLVLINGISIKNIFLGDRSQVWAGMPVKNIARIEIIRGPGSAVFGADAFAGVINIITKTSDDIDGTEFGFRTGSFSTKDAWLLHGGKIGGFDLAFSFQLHSTDGYEETIDSDAQTFFDGLFGTNVSLAPGAVNTERNNIDTRLDLNGDNWKIRIGYQGRRDVGTAAGAAQSLDPIGRGDSDRFNADVTYQNTNLHDDWDFSTQLSYFDTTQETDLILNPAGAAVVLPGPTVLTFPNGVIGNPDVYERHTRINISGFYTGLDNHFIRIGTGYTLDDMYKIRESKNFDLVTGGLPIPIGSVIDVSNESTRVFIRPHDRDIYYVFVQDEWSFAPDWDLTTGVRYDDYSDFGDTVNPRLALVWQTKYNMTSKLLYGRAFRAPSFTELHSINNPVTLGNPDLDPETIDTIELAFNIQNTDDIRTSLSVFHYKMSDILRFTADPAPATTTTAKNTGDQIGDGFEFEAYWKINPDVSLSGHYSWQVSEDEDTDKDAASAPQQQLYTRTDFRINHNWKLNIQANWVADRKRAAGDARAEVDDYITVDTTLRYQQFGSPWELVISGHNIFDEDIREPSPAPGLIPNDFPLAGSSFFLEIGYHL